MGSTSPRGTMWLAPSVRSSRQCGGVKFERHLEREPCKLLYVIKVDSTVELEMSNLKAYAERLHDCAEEVGEIIAGLGTDKFDFWWLKQVLGEMSEISIRLVINAIKLRSKQ